MITPPIDATAVRFVDYASAEHRYFAERGFTRVMRIAPNVSRVKVQIGERVMVAREEQEE